MFSGAGRCRPDSRSIPDRAAGTANTWRDLDYEPLGVAAGVGEEVIVVDADSVVDLADDLVEQALRITEGA
ncbi:hypothetical protein ACQEVF_48815 [Nonomuraea polychroma]|uniref:hypothetical protein n=1 Tax=Nonomuraea polychroma TaxID=46176 RepID=UPI003D8B2728